MIKNFIFDMGNVLVDFCWEKDFRDKGLEGEAFERVANATARNEDWNEYDLANISNDEIIDLFVENDPEMEKEIRLVTSSLSGMIKKMPYAERLINRLKDMGFGVYILSNFSPQALRDAENELTYMKLADGVILSCDYHVIKPYPEIYKILLDKFSLKAEECVFLDDKEENVKGGEAVGIKGIVFKGLDDAFTKLKDMGVSIEL